MFCFFVLFFLNLRFGWEWGLEWLPAWKEYFAMKQNEIIKLWALDEQTLVTLTIIPLLSVFNTVYLCLFAEGHLYTQPTTIPDGRVTFHDQYITTATELCRLDSALARTLTSGVTVPVCPPSLCILHNLIHHQKQKQNQPQNTSGIEALEARSI